MSKPTQLPQELTDHCTLGFFAVPQKMKVLFDLKTQPCTQADQAIIGALETIAQQMLDKPLLSVTHDSVLPPSGDHHDYTSLGTYWWPDPDTADGLPYIRRDGNRNPQTLEGDCPALAQMAQQVVALILAWQWTGKNEYVQKAIDQLRCFFLNPDTLMNPHLQYAQRIPGHCDGRGIGLIDTHHLIPLVELLPCLQHSNLWTTSDQQGMQRWFSQYLDWFEQSEHGQTERNEHNNHGTWHDAQAVAFAIYTDQPDRARAVLKQVPQKRIDQHLATDGSQPHEQARTLSLTYSMFNLEGLCSMAIWGQQLGVDLWHYQGPSQQNLLNAIEYLGHYAQNFSQWPYPQIKPASPWKLASLLHIASRVSDDPIYLQQHKMIPNLLPQQKIYKLVYRDR